MPGAGSALAWDRYAYVNYNALKYVDPSGHTGFVPRKNVLLSDTGNRKGFPGDMLSLPNISTNYYFTSSGGFEGEITVEANNSITVNISIEDNFSFIVDTISLSGDVVLMAVKADNIFGPLFMVDDIVGIQYYFFTEVVEGVQAGLSGIGLIDGLYDAYVEDDYGNLGSAIRGFTVDETLNILEDSGLIWDTSKLAPIVGAILSYIDVKNNCKIEIEWNR